MGMVRHPRGAAAVSPHKTKWPPWLFATDSTTKLRYLWSQAVFTLCSLCTSLLSPLCLWSCRAPTAGKRGPEAGWAFALLLQFAAVPVPIEVQNGARLDGVLCQEEKESEDAKEGGTEEVCCGKESLKGTDPGQLQNHISGPADLLVRAARKKWP